MFETTLSKLIAKNKFASEADILYVAQDNELAHTTINEICKSFVKRFENLESYVQTEVTHPGNIQYKPYGKEEYLTLKENLDLIYERLNTLENK